MTIGRASSASGAGDDVTAMSSGRTPIVTRAAVDGASFDQVHRRAAEERGDERVDGPAVQIHRRAGLHDGAVAQDRDARAERHRFGLIVGHVDHRRAEFLMQALQFAACLQAQLGVEVRQRFVHQVDSRLAHDRAGEGDALLLSAGQLRGTPRQHVGQADARRQPRARADRSPRARRGGCAAETRCCRRRRNAGRAHSSETPSRRRGRTAARR